MTNDGPNQPEVLAEALSSVDPQHQDEAFLVCAECRANHGGWCIDELSPQGRSMCPLGVLVGAAARGDS